MDSPAQSDQHATAAHGAPTPHTPGPWSIHSMSHADVQRCVSDGKTFEYRDVYIGVGDKVIAEVLMWTAGEFGGYPRVDTVEEQDANARLICAAPDLLAACKKVVEYYGDPAQGKLFGLRAAIAKAEGR